MITNRHFLLMMLCFILCSIHAIAQTDYYYYYQGEKIPLTLDENKVVVSIPKEYGETIERICANVQVLETIEDDYFNIFVIKRSEFEKLTSMDTWEKDAKFVLLDSGYFINDYFEGFATPYMTVELKKEQDIDLLTSYAEEYRLRIVEQDSFMPLWYVLSITLETEKTAMEVANALWESRDFAASEPDFAAYFITDVTSIQNITTATTTESTGIYDLQGRRLSGKPARGIYIENGKKIAIK